MKERNKVILVTGLSGSGKTSAMAILEDMGYYCMDNFPIALVDSLIEEVASGKDPRFHYLALTMNALEFTTFYRAFHNSDCDLTVLFLEATKEQLLLRYKYNRRNHPHLISNHANSLEDAIDLEIATYSNIKDYASIIIDTTFLTQQTLTSRIQRYFTIEGKPHLSISFISFGYRNGLPIDADLVLDVRFLPNPFWIEHLRDLTGNDAEVYDYVMEHEKTQEYLGYLEPFLDYSLKQYDLEGKQHMTIAIGCTGGQHRSVSLVNALYKRYDRDYTTFKDHRDLVEMVL